MFTHVRTLVAVIISVLLSSGFSEELECPRYHYEAQTLERIIKAEISWEKTKQDFQQMKQDIEELQRNLSHVSAVKTDLELLSYVVQELKENVTAAQLALTGPDSMRSYCLSDAECTDVASSECKWLTCKCKPGLSYHKTTRRCSPDCGIFGYGATFQEWRATGINGYNNKDFQSVSLEECLMKCAEETEFTCRSADYIIKTKLCRLSVETFLTKPEAIDEDNPGLNHYQRDCKD